MFNRDYNFKGTHANIVTKLTSEIDSKTKFKIFSRNIDVLIVAPIVGYLYGRMSDIDSSVETATDNVKKINFDQINRELDTLTYNYQLIMILHDKDRLPIEKRLERAFKYSDGTLEKEECYKIFEQYILGGIEVLDEEILKEDANDVDDYIDNIYNFLCNYNEKYNRIISNDEILDLCRNSLF